MKISIKHIICVALTLFSFVAQSADLERGDPLRKVLLDRMRSYDLETFKFDVKRIWSDGVFAYVCALPISPEGVYKQFAPHSYELIEVFFRYRYNWNGDASEHHLVNSINENPCRFQKDDEITGIAIELEVKKRWSQARSK